MNLMITGSSGFIGQNFIKKSTEYTIIPVSLKTTSVENINFNSIDTVLHLAGLVHQMQGAPEEEYFKINSDLTFNLAQKAKEKGVKHFIFMSTAKVFGELTQLGAPFNEQSLCLPLDPYSKSKLQAEGRLKTLQADNFCVSIVRIPLVYGKGVKGNLQSLINLVNKLSIIPFGKINNKRSLVYVGNLVDILNKIIEKRISGVFIACDNSALSTSQLISLIANALNKKIVLFEIPAIIKTIIGLFKPNIIDRLYGSFELDNTVTNQIMEYTPRYSIEVGIKDMVKN